MVTKAAEDSSVPIGAGIDHAPESILVTGGSDVDIYSASDAPIPVSEGSDFTVQTVKVLVPVDKPDSSAMVAANLLATKPSPTDWAALLRLADKVGTVTNPVTLIVGKTPPTLVADNGGAQARLEHSDDEFVMTSDGARYRL